MEKVMNTPRLNDVFAMVAKLQDKSDSNRPQPIERDALKLSEETGEVAADILKLIEYKVSKEDKADIRKNLEGEVADVIIMAMVLAHKSNVSEVNLVSTILEKLGKWEVTHIRPFDK